MSKDKIIDELYRNKEIDELINYLTSNNSLKDDLKQELFIILCNMNDEKIIGLYERKEIKYYIIRIIKNQFHSSTSPFYKKYRNIINEPDEIFYPVESDDSQNEIDRMIKEQKQIEQIKDIVYNKVDDKVKQELFLMYYKLDKYDRYDGTSKDETCDKPISSLRKIERKLNRNGYTIDHSTISLKINEVKDFIKKELGL